MRRYRLQIGGAAVNLSAPDFQRGGGFFGLVRDLVSNLGAYLITIFLAVVSLIPIFHANFDSVILYYGLYAVILLLAGWAIVSILVGSKFTIDPPLFVPVLLFALLTTTAYLLSPNDPLRPTDPRNTFGVDGARFIAAIGVITFIFLFYFFVTYLRSAGKILWASRALLFGAALVPVVYLLVTKLKISVLFSAQMDVIGMFLALWIPMSLLLILFRPLRKSAQALLIVSFVLSVWLSFQDFSLINSFVTTITLIVSLITYLWFRSDEFNGLGKYFRENIGATFTGEKNWQEFIFKTRAAWFLGFILVWIVIVLLTAITNKYNIGVVVNSIAADYSGAFQTLKDARTLIVGNGAAAKLTGVSFADVVSFQGLLGIFAYIIITVAVVRTSFIKLKQYLQSVKGSNSSAWVWFPVIIGVPLLALIAQLNMLVALLWWVGATLLSAELVSQLKEKEMTVWETWKLKSKALTRVIPIVQIVVIFVISVVAITLVNMLTDLFIKGVI